MTNEIFETIKAIFACVSCTLIGYIGGYLMCYHSNDKPKEKLPLSKIAFIFMMVNCVVIEIYALITIERLVR